MLYISTWFLLLYSVSLRRNQQLTLLPYPPPPPIVVICSFTSTNHETVTGECAPDMLCCRGENQSGGPEIRCCPGDMYCGLYHRGSGSLLCLTMRELSQCRLHPTCLLSDFSSVDKITCYVLEYNAYYIYRVAM